MVVGIATGMTGSNEPGRFASARTASGSTLNHRLDIGINVTGDPYAGLIVEGAGGRVDHWKMGGEIHGGGIDAPAVVLRRTACRRSDRPRFLYASLLVRRGRFARPSGVRSP